MVMSVDVINATFVWTRNKPSTPLGHDKNAKWDAIEILSGTTLSEN
jgi:hypothetical protein